MSILYLVPRSSGQITGSSRPQGVMLGRRNVSTGYDVGMRDYTTCGCVGRSRGLLSAALKRRNFGARMFTKMNLTSLKYILR